MSDNPTDIERDRDRKANELEFLSRQLAGNLLRMIRGAGRPYNLFDEILRAADCIREFPEGTTVGHITDAIQAALSDGLRRDSDFGGGPYQMEKGALRAVAGRIMGQHLQATAGENELWEGFYALERFRERSRDERVAQPRPTFGRVRVSPIRPTSARKPKGKKLTPLPKPVALAKPVAAEPEPPPRTTADYMAFNAKLRRDGKEPI